MDPNLGDHTGEHELYVARLLAASIFQVPRCAGLLANIHGNEPYRGRRSPHEMHCPKFFTGVTAASLVSSTNFSEALVSFKAVRELPVAMNQAPSKGTRCPKRQTQAKLPLILHWRHQSLRGLVDSVQRWLADALSTETLCQNVCMPLDANTNTATQDTTTLPRTCRD